MIKQNKMKEYTDKYFLRSNEILKAKGMNPWVNMQVFVRRGPGKVFGIDEAIEIVKENGNILESGGKIYAKDEGDCYAPKETVMNIIAPIQDIIELETVYLGVLTTATSRYNDGMELDFNKIGDQMRDVVKVAGDRPVLYFGARHWHWSHDSALANLAYENGCRYVATDNGAKQKGESGVGTTPHALENIFAYYYGYENAVKESIKAFDKVIDSSVPRVALVDYANKEITDSIETARALEGRLSSVRVDTCGENIAEGGVSGTKKYWEDRGVTVEGVYALRKALDDGGYNDVGITLSSGFSNPAKVQAFNDGEKKYGVKLYDAIGAGFLDGPRTFTADVIAVGESLEEVDFYSGKVKDKNIIHKVGRPPRLNKNLERRL